MNLRRLDALALFAACAVLLLVNHGQVHWGWFLGLFAAIDLVGYLPGAILHRARGKAPAWAYHAYNLAHGVPFSLALALVYCELRGAPDWTLLALPLHLCADRGLLGNGFKRLDEPFDRSGGTYAVPPDSPPAEPGTTPREVLA